KITVYNKPPDGGISNSAFLGNGAAKTGEAGAVQITAIIPYRVVEGSPAFEVTMNGTGFTPNSMVRAGDTQLATTFMDAETLRAHVPADLIARALPNRFNAPGPGQNNGVYGDRTIKLAVSNGRPEEISNSLSMRVVAK